jgi:membrane-bound serine protease (ClpP class)
MGSFTPTFREAPVPTTKTVSPAQKAARYLAIISIFLAFLPFFAFARDGVSDQSRPIVVFIPLDKEVDEGLLDSVKRRVFEAEALDPSLIVFKIDTYGGLATAAMEITDAIGAVEEPKTVAYVPLKAYSAGAMISMGAREIVLGPLASIGDAAPVIFTNEGPKELGEKHQSPGRNLFRKFAQRNGYPQSLVEAMVSAELEVVEVTYKDGTLKYLLRGEFDDLTDAEKADIEHERTVVREGELLTLTAEEALEYGIARFIAKDSRELLADYGLSDAKVVTLEISWSEKLVRTLNNQAVSGIILLVGLMGLYMEFKVPGFGLPGTVGVICLAIFFWSKHLSGMAASWEIIIFVLGVILLAVEIFVIPGFGVTGLAGALLIVLGLAFTYVPRGITFAPMDMDYLVRTGGYFIATLAAVFVAAIGLTWLLPKVPIVGRFYLGEPEAETVGHRAGAGVTEGKEGLVGRAGIAMTMLRPAGRARIGDDYFDVTTEGGIIERGDAVEVIAIRSNSIIVRPQR